MKVLFCFQFNVWGLGGLIKLAQDILPLVHVTIFYLKLVKTPADGVLDINHISKSHKSFPTLCKTYLKKSFFFFFFLQNIEWICDIQSNLPIQSPLLSSHLYYTVKPAHTVTSIKQSPVLKSHFFSCPVIEHSMWIVPLLRGHIS